MLQFYSTKNKPLWLSTEYAQLHCIIFSTYAQFHNAITLPDIWGFLFYSLRPPHIYCLNISEQTCAVDLLSAYKKPTALTWCTIWWNNSTPSIELRRLRLSQFFPTLIFACYNAWLPCPLCQSARQQDSASLVVPRVFYQQNQSLFNQTSSLGEIWPLLFYWDNTLTSCFFLCLASRVT